MDENDFTFDLKKPQKAPSKKLKTLKIGASNSHKMSKRMTKTIFKK